MFSVLVVVRCRPVFADHHFNGAQRRLPASQIFLPPKSSLALHQAGFNQVVLTNRLVLTQTIVPLPEFLWFWWVWDTSQTFLLSKSSSAMACHCQTNTLLYQMYKTRLKYFETLSSQKFWVGTQAGKHQFAFFCLSGLVIQKIICIWDIYDAQPWQWTENMKLWNFLCSVPEILGVPKKRTNKTNKNGQTLQACQHSKVVQRVQKGPKW